MCEGGGGAERRIRKVDEKRKRDGEAGERKLRGENCEEKDERREEERREVKKEKKEEEKEKDEKGKNRKVWTGGWLEAEGKSCEKINKRGRVLKALYRWCLRVLEEKRGGCLYPLIIYKLYTGSLGEADEIRMKSLGKEGIEEARRVCELKQPFFWLRVFVPTDTTKWELETEPFYWLRCFKEEPTLGVTLYQSRRKKGDRGWGNSGDMVLSVPPAVLANVRFDFDNEVQQRGMRLHEEWVRKMSDRDDVVSWLEDTRFGGEKKDGKVWTSKVEAQEQKMRVAQLEN